MRSVAEVQRVLSLVQSGLNDCEIARRTGIPRETVRDWRSNPKRAQRLNPRGSCQLCGHPQHDFSELSSFDYAYLLGLYLGDGGISKARREVFRLRITLDLLYPGIIEECRAAMSFVMPRNRVLVQRRHGSRCVDVGSYSRSWPCLFPQHASGKKHERRIRLAPWQSEHGRRQPERLLRGLIHSDGSRSINTIRHPNRTYRYPRYLFTNKSEDIRRIFCETCDFLGIEWRQMNRQNISVARRASVARLDEFIGPKR